MTSKYYWLKLRKDYLKRHDIRILESVENGQLSVLFYLKLMLESVDHEGELRFSEKMPYSPEMLATITETDPEIAKVSLERLEALGMVEITDDGTIRLPKVAEMIGSASDTDEARRAKRYRENKKARCDETSRTNVTPVTHDVTERHESKSKRQSKRQSKSKRQSNTYIFVEPTIEEIFNYCQERHNTINPQLFFDYYSAKGWCIGSGGQMKDWKAAVRAWENNEINYKKGDAI